MDVSLVVTECSGTKSDEHITSSSSWTYITHVVDADIRPVNDQVPYADVHLTTQHNVLANVQQYTNQSEPSYDTYLLEKVDSNTTPDSTNMCHRGGEIDQDAEHDQVKSPLLKAEFLKTNDMVEKEVNDQVPSAEVHLTTQHNVLSNVQHHTNQSEPSYDIYLLEKVDSNTTPDSTNMCHRGGEIDQAEFLKINDMVEKEAYNELSNRFLQL
ncbi:hypothetical protein Tco_0203612, partial [Tanacetum coccineum]